MKKKFLFAALIFAIIVIAMYNIGFQFGNVSIGKQYDEIELNNKFDIQNSQFSKEYLKSERYIVITLWASWCEPCIKEFPVLKKIQEEFPDILFATLSTDKSEKEIVSSVEKYDLENDITLANANYRKAIRNFLDRRNSNSLIQSEIIPVTYIIKKGKVIYKETGTLDYDSFKEKLKNLK